MTVTPVSFSAKVGTAPDGNGLYGADPVGAGVVPLSASLVAKEATVATDVATVAANVATLVADGASPTQAHVTTLNTNWTTLSTDWTALKGLVDTYRTAADLATAGQVSITYDTTAITSMNQLRSAIKEILAQIEASGLK